MTHWRPTAHGHQTAVVEDVVSVPQGSFTLRRRHHDPTGSLRAWTAADEYVLGRVHDEAVTGDCWLVVNDSFGALAVAGIASGRHVTSWSDSSVAHAAAATNLVANGLADDDFEVLPSVTTPSGPFDVVIVKVPRTLAHLEDQLARLRPSLSERTVVIGAGMTREVHRSTIDAFERCIGPTPTTRALKKARLLLAQVDPDLDAPPPPVPATWRTPEGLVVTASPNVFSSTRLDRGTALLLEHLPAPPDEGTVIDLGCGSGVVAATIAQRHRGVRVVCCDESYEAVQSARATVGRVTATASFHVTDVLDGIEGSSADVVVVNPPFHAGGARTDAVALRMVTEAHRVLRPGGSIHLVANRHLDHHAAVRRTFGRVSVTVADSRFSVLTAIR